MSDDKNLEWYLPIDEEISNIAEALEFLKDNKTLVAIAKCLFCGKTYYADTVFLHPPIASCDCANKAVAQAQRFIAKTREVTKKDHDFQNK